MTLQTRAYYKVAKRPGMSTDEVVVRTLELLNALVNSRTRLVCNVLSWIGGTVAYWHNLF